MKTVVTKAEYAALKGRGPSAVSNWIAEGKITPTALVGEGVRARIWVEQADRDLALRLDPSQQAAQAQPVMPATVPLAPSEQPANLPLELPQQSHPFHSGAGGQNTDDADLRRKRKADADRAEHDAEAARRKNALDEGRWIDAAEAAREWGRELARIRTETETFLFTTLARSLGDRFGLDWKAVAVLMRDQYRAHCQGVVDEALSHVERRETELAQAAE
jgi:hypothetical protein